MDPVVWQPHEDLAPNIADALVEAVPALPLHHLRPLAQDEEFQGEDQSVQRCIDYASAHGYGLVTQRSSGKEQRMRLICKSHGTETRNYCKLTEEDRHCVGERGHYTCGPNNQTSQQGCPFQLSVAYRRLRGSGRTTQL